MAVIRENHNRKHMAQKSYHDNRTKAIPKEIATGDLVLIRQLNTLRLPFDPHPYKVGKVKGNQLTLNKGDAKRIWDKNYIKKVAPRRKELIPSWQKLEQWTPTNYQDFEI